MVTRSTGATTGTRRSISDATDCGRCRANKLSCSRAQADAMHHEPGEVLSLIRMSHDLIVIGTGPGGYVCAIRAAQLGHEGRRRREARNARRHLPQRRLHPVEGAAARVRAVRGGRPRLRRHGHRRRAEAQPREDARLQGRGREGQRRRRRLSPEEEQDRALPRHRPRARHRQGRGHLHQRREEDARGEVDRDRHRLGCRQAARRRRSTRRRSSPRPAR